MEQQYSTLPVNEKEDLIKEVSNKTSTSVSHIITTSNTNDMNNNNNNSSNRKNDIPIDDKKKKLDKEEKENDDSEISTSSASTPSNGKIVFRNTGPNGLVSVVNAPVCKNCSTSTTPLWRRDENGAILCNACGLFLKLHGRPRPISLKTDVIKSRNRKNNCHGENTSNNSTDSNRNKKERASASDKKRKSPLQYNNNNNNSNNSVNQVSEADKTIIPQNSNSTETMSKQSRNRNKNNLQNYNDNTNNNIKEHVVNSDPTYKQIPVHYNIPNIPVTDSTRIGNNSSPHLGIVNVSSQLPGLSTLLTTIGSGVATTENNLHNGTYMNDNTNGNINGSNVNSENTEKNIRSLSPPILKNDKKSVVNSFQQNEHIPLVSNQSQSIMNHQPIINNMTSSIIQNSPAVNMPIQNPQCMPSNVPFEPLNKEPQFNPLNSNTMDRSTNSNNIVSDIGQQPSESSNSSEVRSEHSSQIASSQLLSQNHYASIPNVSNPLSTPEITLPAKYNKTMKKRKVSIESEVKEYSLEERLQHEEEIIRLKTKIAELESVTNLYRNHLFKLNEKCQKYEEQLANLNK